MSRSNSGYNDFRDIWHNFLGPLCCRYIRSTLYLQLRFFVSFYITITLNSFAVNVLVKVSSRNIMSFKIYCKKNWSRKNGSMHFFPCNKLTWPYSFSRAWQRQPLKTEHRSYYQCSLSVNILTEAWLRSYHAHTGKTQRGMVQSSFELSF